MHIIKPITGGLLYGTQDKHSLIQPKPRHLNVAHSGTVLSHSLAANVVDNKMIDENALKVSK